MEQVIKDMLQLGFSFFVAAYLLIVMTNLLKDLREAFIKLQTSVEELAKEIRLILTKFDERQGKGNPQQN